MELTAEQEEFKAKLHSISFGKVPGGARDKASAERKREKRWDKDMSAYAELRKQGLQPQGIDGCGDLATMASDKWEIDHGIALSADLKNSHLSALKDVEAATEPIKDVAPWRPGEAK